MLKRPLFHEIVLGNISHGERERQSEGGRERTMALFHPIQITLVFVMCRLKWEIPNER